MHSYSMRMLAVGSLMGLLVIAVMFTAALAKSPAHLVVVLIDGPRYSESFAEPFAESDSVGFGADVPTMETTLGILARDHPRVMVVNRWRRLSPASVGPQPGR